MSGTALLGLLVLAVLALGILWLLVHATEAGGTIDRMIDRPGPGLGLALVAAVALEVAAAVLVVLVVLAIT